MYFEYHPESVSALQAQMLESIAGGNRHIVLGLDALPRLDTAGVRGLITLLRRARAAGGDVALSVTRAEIVRSLKVMALDRLFSIVGEAA